MSEVVNRTEPIRYAFIEHVGPYPEIGGAFQKLFGIVAPAGLVKPGYQSLGRYFNDPGTTPAAELQSHAGLIIDSEAVVPDGIEEATIPAGKFCVHRHLGSYSGLPEAWATAMSTLTGIPDGPPFEVYVNDCTEVAEADLITDIYVPII